EHFADMLTTMACAATPLADPVTGRILGVVDITCLVGDASPLMLPLVKRAAREIEQRLLEEMSVDERLLREEFLRARRHHRGPLASVGPGTMLMNGPAAGLFSESDREALWSQVARQSGATTANVTLVDGRNVALRAEPVLDDDRVVGALVTL